MKKKQLKQILDNQAVLNSNQVILKEMLDELMEKSGLQVLARTINPTVPPPPPPPPPEDDDPIGG